MQALLSNRLPDGLDWSGKKFYYVPFTYSVMTNILTLAAVSDTLISNHADSGTFTRLTSANFRNFGPAGALIFEKLAEVVGTDTSKMDALDRVCRSTEPITLETIQLVYDVIVASGYCSPLPPLSLSIGSWLLAYCLLFFQVWGHLHVHRACGDAVNGACVQDDDGESGVGSVLGVVHTASVQRR